MEIIAELFLFLLLFISLVSIIFGLPGTWFMVVILFFFSLVSKWSFPNISAVILAFVFAIVGEVGEQYFGVKEPLKAGASTKAVLSSFIGAIIGSILLASFLYGIGAIIGGSIGAFAGALLYTLVVERKKYAVQISWRAAIGRMKGLLFKGAMGMFTIITTGLSLIFGKG